MMMRLVAARSLARARLLRASAAPLATARALTPKEDYPIRPTTTPGVFTVSGTFLKAFGLYRGMQVSAALLSPDSKYCYVPPKYAVQSSDERWPEELRGYKLGHRALQINRFLRHKHKGPVQPVVANLGDLREQGFVFNFLEYRFHLLVLCIDAYRKNCPGSALQDIPKSYIVGKRVDSVGKIQPSGGDAQWPAEAVGVYLGRLLHHFKHQRKYYSAFRQELRRLYPEDFPRVLQRYGESVVLGGARLNKDRDLYFSDILSALRAYRAIHETELFSAPVRYEVHADDERFPESVRGRNLGYICHNVTAAKSYQHATYRSEVTKIAPHFYSPRDLVLRPAVGQRRGLDDSLKALRGIVTAKFLAVYSAYRDQQLQDPVSAQVARELGWVAVPGTFVVPSCGERAHSWPAAFRGYALGEVSTRVLRVLGPAALARLVERLLARRARGGSAEELPDREVEELLLRLAELQYPPRDARFGRFYYALLLYKKHCGDINSIPHDFLCRDAPWPTDLLDYPLGQRAARLKLGLLRFASSDAHSRALLQRAGLDLSPPLPASAEYSAAEACGLAVSDASVRVFIEASSRYRQLQDVTFIQRSCAIAEDDERYPPHLRGYPLGRAQELLQRSLRSELGSGLHATLRALLLAHDSCFFRDRNSVRFDAYLQALRVYRQETGSLRAVPVYAEIDRSDRRYPAYVRLNQVPVSCCPPAPLTPPPLPLRQRPFGRILYSLRQYSFQDDRWRDQIRLIEPSFYEDLGARALLAPEPLRTGADAPSVRL